MPVSLQGRISLHQDPSRELTSEDRRVDSGAPKTVLSVTFTMSQYADLMRVIKRIDPTAFVSISQAHEINGEGFTYGSHD